MRFWNDNWCSEVPFCDLFSKLNSMVGSKEVKVMEF